MLPPEKITALRDAAGKLADPINDFLLTDIARRVAEAGQLTSTAAYEVWVSQNLGQSQAEFREELKKLLEVSEAEISRLMTQSAEVGYTYDLDQLPTAEAIPFERNGSIQQIVAAAVTLAEQDFTNLTQTLGMVDPFGRALPLQAVYRSCTDFAFQQVITGAADYNTALRLATEKLAKRGVVTIDYESGIATSLEAAVRRNIMGGLGLMQEQISQRNHDDLGADGWEISAHACCAPDHEPIQGRQYTDAEYVRLNGSLRRRIGTLNCGHAAFPIVLGVSKPQHTERELEKLRQDNEDGVWVDGVHYSGYEATQVQRKLERSIRAQKRQILIDQAAEDGEHIGPDSARLVVLEQSYQEFSEKAGLRTEKERLHMAGFGRKEAALANYARKKEIEKYREIRYHEDGTVVVTDDWTGKKRPHLDGRYKPNAVVDTVSRKGAQRDRMYYDSEGRQQRQISNGPHSNPKGHPFGDHGEHAHDILWEDGRIVSRAARELTDRERKENADIL